MSSSVPVITVDGPSGSGKGTLSLLLAKQMRWHFLDSGALYRLLGLYAQKMNISVEDEAAVAKLGLQLPVRFGNENEEFTQIWLEDDDVTTILRTETTGFLASSIAKFPAVRSALFERQRNFRTLPGLVADGRDMGTVIFPDAPLKFFLEASPEERANRRFKQLQARGLSVSLDSLLTEINERDKQDRNRSVAPLIPASDALILDTTHLSIAGVFNEMIAVIKSKFPMWLPTLG